MVRSFHGGLRSRLNDPRSGVIIVVQQRLHRGDLIGSIMDSAEAGDWTFLSFPIVATQDESIVFPITGKVVHRAKGDLLQPARWDKQWCDREALADPSVWNAEYQQSPSDSSESILKDHWFKHWVHAGTLEKPEGALLLPDRFDGDGSCHVDENLLQRLKGLMREEYAQEIVTRNGRRRARGYPQAALTLRIDVAAALAENEHYSKTFPAIMR